MNSSTKLMCAILLSAALLVFGPSTARALTVGVSDQLNFTWDGQFKSVTNAEVPGEAVTEEIDFTFTTNPLKPFDSNNFTSDFVYLVEPGTVTATFSDGTVQGDRSDDIQLKVSHETGASTTTITVTLNSDEDPGTHNSVRGFLETGELQTITAPLFGTSLTDSGHTALVQVASDVETTAVPEPASMLLLGSGLLGLAGYGRKRFSKK